MEINRQEKQENMVQFTKMGAGESFVAVKIVCVNIPLVETLTCWWNVDKIDLFD